MIHESYLNVSQKYGLLECYEQMVAKNFESNYRTARELGGYTHMITLYMSDTTNTVRLNTWKYLHINQVES